MKIWHISDTHNLHRMLNDVVPDVDCVIHSGDCTNSKDIIYSIKESEDFLDWFSSLKIPKKIMIAGNHDIAISQDKNLIPGNITYLFNSSCYLGEYKVWGSPYTPAFGKGWAFNMHRKDLWGLWSTIPDDCDILVTHGPPKGILDYVGNTQQGCKSLYNRVIEVEPLMHLFGHIHNSKQNHNAGIKTLSGWVTQFSNGSVKPDGPEEYAVNNIRGGNILLLEGDI